MKLILNLKSLLANKIEVSLKPLKNAMKLTVNLEESKVKTTNEAVKLTAALKIKQKESKWRSETRNKLLFKN
jgi:hypothetical protein